MEPVEINAGTWYLRALRADDRIDDRPAVLASCLDPEILRWRRRPEPTLEAVGAHIAERAAEWAGDTRCSWAVCEPTTGDMLGEVSLASLDLAIGTAEVACWALPAARGKGMITTAVSSVLRFGFGGLGLHRVTYAWAEGNEASARVAAKCGFTIEGRQRSGWVVDGRRVDVMLAGRLAADGD
ncbi:GNAT family N-acetyltransferase [Pseudonocardia acidicola]|uniref:GNAT family N-acetyltransferase n=1 Tax=Pseudonocardia acidicola TaxID=2724939 RepID=A0ABX1SH97_9PSEU|nr:GNAT family N-acetyltransferase [Pseudonocardia acidicola]NMH99843.1 GNAT family N-acetyltransferase [Pseudonocardia acidicola]